jgi:CRP/FNR family transcriptional regulator, cyclic AMP receptor protein
MCRHREASPGDRVLPGNNFERYLVVGGNYFDLLPTKFKSLAIYPHAISFKTDALPKIFVQRSAETSSCYLFNYLWLDSRLHPDSGLFLLRQSRPLASANLQTSRSLSRFMEDYMATNATIRKVTPLGTKPKKNSAFDAQVFLESVGVSRRVQEFGKKETIFSQGDTADSVMYVQTGSVKLTVVNDSGKEAVVAIFGSGEFFGEGGMAGQTVRMATATAIVPTAVLIIGKDEMKRVLHAEHALSDRFITYMLARNIRVEADLIDQLFNSTEKRLARTLLLLARYGEEGQPERVLQKVSQEILAEMIGTTRSRVNLFMNKFRKLGFIEYNGEIKVNKSLLTVVLHE